MVYLEPQQYKDLLTAVATCETPAIDTEGFSEENNHRIAYDMTSGVSAATATLDDYFPYNHKLSDGTYGENFPPEYLGQLKDVLENHEGTLVFHNAKHDINALRRLGINYEGPFYDTMLMAHMINENTLSKKLDYLSKLYGGKPKNRPVDMETIIKAFGWGWVPVNMMREYARNDARITYDLFVKLLSEFKEQDFDGPLWDVEQQIVRLSGAMEMIGIKIDTDLCEAEAQKGRKIMAEQIKSLGLNPASPKDLEKLLIDELGLPVLRRTPKKKAPCFDKEVMEAYDQLLRQTDDPRAKQVLRYRAWSKVVSTNYDAYLRMLSPDGRLRPNYLLHGTVTGRLSCREPNLQNIPRVSKAEHNGRLKKAFIPAEGFRLIEVDYSQLELRLAAAYAKETSLIEVLNDSNRDVFAEMATALRMPRDKAKTLNYTIQYGGGNTRISEVFGVSQLAAGGIRANYFRTFPNLRAISALAARRCVDNGYVNYWTGRRRHFQNPEREAHKAFNSVIQGGAVEIVKRAMLRLKDVANDDNCRMLLQIHDSVVFEVREDLESKYIPEIEAIMSDVKPDFGVKFPVDSHEWGE